LILISHDRDFLQGLSDRVLEFKDHKLKEYLGDINLYLEQKNLDSLIALEAKEKIKTQKPTNQKNDYEIQKKIKSLRNRQSKIECEIADLENNIKGIDFELEINYEETIAKPNFFEEYNGKKDHLAVLMQKWEVVLEELMEIEN
ncbi:MAG: ABC transporter ATP-binding protein, partial [Flavobacteriaceae bacterium]|nr:ABC transporter ATP-binding protein [Flavobacteriaceae bacterium]